MIIMTPLWFNTREIKTHFRAQQILILKDFIFNYVYMSVCVHGVQKRPSDPQELKLQVVVTRVLGH